MQWINYLQKKCTDLLEEAFLLFQKEEQTRSEVTPVK